MKLREQEIVNRTQIEEYKNEVYEQFDLDARLSRYETMTPELIELASSAGLDRVADANRALFIADFVLTSSEFSSTVSDEERRVGIVKMIKAGLENRNNDSSVLLEIFYLANKIHIQMKRNNSYLAGRGVEQNTRKMILFDLFLLPFMAYSNELLGEGDIAWEYSVIEGVIKEELPDQVLNRNMEKNIIPDKITTFLWELVDYFSSSHRAELNQDSPLPNIAETKTLYLYSGDDNLYPAFNNLDKEIDEETLQLSQELVSYLNSYDNENPLIYLRGRMLSKDKNIILTRSPFSKGKPLLLFESPADEINVTEIQEIMALRSTVDAQWLDTGLVSSLKDYYEEEVTEQVKETKEIDVEEEVEVPKKKKIGLLGRIKRAIFGGGEKEGSKEETETKTVTKKVEKSFTKNIKKLITRERVLTQVLPNFLATSLGIYALADLRLFEKFDTIREAEYRILGSLVTDFKSKETQVLVTPGYQNIDQLNDLLDGLDQAIERVVNNFFGGENQLLPTEILFITKEGDRLILTLDGNDKNIIGTIAATYEKDITNWQNDEQIEAVQRRTLHMRTGQLLSAMAHTPFDRAVERILGGSITGDAKIIKLDKAILPI